MKRGKSLISDKSTEADESKTVERNISKLLQILPKSSADLKQKISDSLHDFSNETDHSSVMLLLNRCSDLLFEASYKSSLSSSEIVLDLSWEKLNSFHWKDVPVTWQKTYSFACLFKACCLSVYSSENLQLREICRICDMGLLMGFNILDGILHKIVHIFRPPATKSVFTFPSICEMSTVESKFINPVRYVSSPSLSNFCERMKVGCPFIIENCIEHWPARKLWNFDYLNDVAGHRLVPIELGSKYTDNSWGQSLMTISDFITNHIVSKESIPKAYLAQHRLFDQIPHLKDDIYIPDYCCISKLDDCNAETDTEINAWFGPGGTVSPCHYDIKHNLLAQVVGRKYVRLYSTSCQNELYPREGILHNTSSVDVESPDNDLFPLFAEMDKSKREECILHPGQMLYIPPGYWHHIRSLDESFSVSFWWV